MYNNDDIVALRAALQESIQANHQSAKAMLTLRTEMVQREQNIRAAFNQELQSLRNEVSATRREVASIASGAGAKIEQDAQQALTQVAVKHDRNVSEVDAKVRSVAKTAWLLHGTAGAILLLLLLVGWAVLGYYRRELAATKGELQRYENAVPVVQAFYTSDAIVCGDRICVNIDPNGQRQGDKRQYRQAKPRQQR
ncbi:hypothetical protein ACWA5G_10005 [Xanthomonas axonopodis pv. ricini]|uniref:hypothetical protein n=1 Tax=Xanthomonas euvesicatoria TaxID=456327 RepID=UPI002453A2A2|nr:hypothetical protein [Xanthomonas euvesicatoria]MDH4908281.1 hypothetical protein [Xanthomonas euvesicatoria]